MDHHQTVPIASLTPDVVGSSAKAIRAIVTLLWPYSSATRTSSLLLADPDFRLRRTKGQVRVFLQGAAAQAVAESQIGIGDEVILGLEGAQWQEDASSAEAISTPGKNVDWQLVYRRRIVCKIDREGRTLARVDVDQRGASPEKSVERQVFATPAGKPLQHFPHSTPTLLWKHGRLSGDSLTFSPYDPFADGDTRQRKRLRRSWNDVEAWKLSDRPPSPEKHVDLLADDESSEPSSGENTAHGDDQAASLRADRSPTKVKSTGRPGDVDLRPNAVQPTSKGTSKSSHAANDSGTRMSKQGTQQTAIINDSIQASDAIQSAIAEGRRFRVYQDERSALLAFRKPISKEVAQPHAVTSVSPGPTHAAQGGDSSTPEHRNEDVNDTQTIDETFASSDVAKHPQISELGPAGQRAGLQEEPIILSDSTDGDESSADEKEEKQRQDAQSRSGFGAEKTETPSLSGLTVMMPPPNPPTLVLRKASDRSNAGNDTSRRTPKTPELRGVASPTLPLPSPFPVADEATTTSFLEVHPREVAEPSLPSLPKTIKETLTEEKKSANLTVPPNRDRKSRSSSSSSYRKESGPFIDRIRPARGFGLDDTEAEIEEAVVDSPELQPIRRDIPGLKSLQSLEKAAVDLRQTLDRDTDHELRDVAPGNGDKGISQHHDLLGSSDHYDPSTWAPDEWLESSQGFIHGDATPRGEAGTAGSAFDGPVDHGTSLLALASNESQVMTMDSLPSQDKNRHEVIDLDGDDSMIQSSQMAEPGHAASSEGPHATLDPPQLETSVTLGGQEVDSHASHTYWPLQLTPPPTAPSVDAQQEGTLLSPHTTYQSQTMHSFGVDGHVDAALPPTPSRTQDHIGSSPGGQRQAPSGHKMMSPKFSDAVSPWFAPSRNSIKLLEAQEEPGLRPRSPGIDNTQETLADLRQPDSKAPGLSQDSATGTNGSLQTKARLFDISKHITANSTGVQTRSKDALRSNDKQPVPKGLRTALSYYTPLHPALLRPFLNNSSTHESTVDVMAVVSSPPTIAKRAAKGPRDWHKLLSVATPNTLAASFEWPRGEVRVQCFMRGANGRTLLPRADPGDVILLRDFSVVSQNGQLELLNRSRGCGWCVFKWRVDSESRSLKEGEMSSEGEDAERMWQEECLGAPVEVGEEERREAVRLRQWWERLIASESEDFTG